MTDDHKIRILEAALNRIWLGGYHELSSAKIEAEYHYFVKLAGEALAKVKEGRYDTR
jgi:hypothetical protein